MFLKKKIPEPEAAVLSNGQIVNAASENNGPEVSGFGCREMEVYFRMHRIQPEASAIVNQYAA